MTTISAIRTGASLVETTLALGIASVCLTTLLGLLPIGFQTDHHAIQESLAADILGAVANDLRIAQTSAQPGETTNSPHFGVAVPAGLLSNPISSTLFFTGDSQFSTSASPNSRCRLAIRFLPNVEFPYVVPVHLKMTWPADAPPENATACAELFLALNRH